MSNVKTLIFLIGFGIVQAQILFNVAPSSISVTAYKGGTNPTSRVVTLTVSGSSSYLPWTASSTPVSWLATTPSTDNIYLSNFFTISFDISNQNVGTQSTIISVSLEGKQPPTLITVSLTVLDSNCEARLSCDNCLTSTKECGWCADSENVTLGTCISSSGQCNATEYFPNYCPIPCSTVCIHGYCVLSHGVCSCDFHYYGAECDVYCNPSQNCSSQGICAADGSCSCYGGYYGNSCEFKDCPGNGCSGHGICNNRTGVCTCDANYYGNDCSKFCNSTQCIHGSCSNSAGQCYCDPNYYGYNCNTYCTEALNCSNHGYCSYVGCECFADYYERNCSVYCLSDQTCSSNGICSTTTGQCICNEGYYSSDCSMKHCPGYNASNDLECNGNGLCNSGNCYCDPNWFTANCSVFCDQETTCSGHGTCSEVGSCLCQDGYEGGGCKETEEGGHKGIIAVLVVVCILVVGGAIGVFVFIIRKQMRKSKGYTLIQ